MNGRKSLAKSSQFTNEKQDQNEAKRGWHVDNEFNTWENAYIFSASFVSVWNRSFGISYQLNYQLFEHPLA